jgi:tripartite-type tricarboxylate transporter receptor subunit TctC
MGLTRRQHLIQGGHFAFSLIAGGALTSVAGGAAAQSGEVSWPTSKPIKLLIPAQPGGGLDLVARTTADRLARLMSVPWVCENIGGGGGSIAATTVVRAAPDGQTFMITNISTHGTNPAVRKLSYDPIKDFSHVAMVGGTPNVLLVGPTLSQVGSVGELIARIKARDGQAAYGSAGPGTSSHLLMEQFKAATGTQLTHIPYRGIGPAMVDLIAGRTDIAFPGLTAATSFIKSSRLKPLAVTSSARVFLAWATSQFLSIFIGLT